MNNSSAMQTGVAEVNGVRLVYDTAGTGQPLVLVHAGIADRRMWDDQFHVFAQHFHVIRYDMRGFGETPIVAGPFAHREDLYGLLQYLGIAQAHLLGCSQGGTTIIDFALEHPEMVRSLIPVCSTPSGYQLSGDPPPQLQAVNEAMDANDFERAAELEVQIWVDGLHRTPDQVRGDVRDRVRAMNVIALRNEATGLGEFQQLVPTAVQRLASIHLPTLVVIGDLDVPGIVAAGEMVAATIPGARKTVVTGTAHVPNMERPDEFNRIVLDFLMNIERNPTTT